MTGTGGCSRRASAEECRTDGDMQVTHLPAEGEDTVLTSYRVLPGISLMYEDIHTQRCTVGNRLPDTAFEIHHCRLGRMECDGGSSLFYLTPGDLSVACPAIMGREVFFPLGHYHGLSVTVDTAHTPGCLSCLLEDVDVDPARLMQRYRGTGEGCICRSDVRIGHIFSELYAVPEGIRKGYFKLKVLELLLFLSSMTADGSETGAHAVAREHMELAKGVAQYLTVHMEERITLEVLAGIFHRSATQIKTCFREVYGESVYAFIRAQKMQAAAGLLRSSDATVLEVAGRFGYDNGSKFARAFSAVMGVNPAEYRRAQRDR